MSKNLMDYAFALQKEKGFLYIIWIFVMKIQKIFIQKCNKGITI